MSEYWDHRYRKLEEGEVIQPGDKMLVDKEWEPASCVGGRAPSPYFTSHTWFRRLKASERLEEAVNVDILAMNPEEVLEEARGGGDDTAAFAARMDMWLKDTLARIQA